MEVYITDGSSMQAQDWLTKILSKAHLSLVMALQMIVVGVTIYNDINRPQGILINIWISELFGRIGLYVDAFTWIGLLFFFATIIAFTRPLPTATFFFAWPLIVYGGLMVIYAYETERLPLPVLVMMISGFIAWFFVMMAWPTLVQAIQEIMALRQHTNEEGEKVANGTTRTA